ncbi:hypothetical protein TNCV_1314561 [Trichonephila clavipes]|nr:hypothetical protein TNCV_1314561 [Trichonephila clavipes]
MDLWLAGYVFESSATEDPPCRGVRCNSSGLKRLPVDVVWKSSKRWMTSQMSFTTLDCTSILRGPSLIALVQLCIARANWSVRDWKRVVFSEGSRFSISADDQRIRMSRQLGHRYNPTFVVEKRTAVTQGAALGAIFWDT